MKAIIVDDERLARKELTSLLASHPEIEIIDEAANPDEAIEKIEKQDPDVVFLDIQMPGKTGFEMLEDMERVPQVIFTTAYDEFALKAFEYNALDYLLKPIQPERLTEALNKVTIKASKKSAKDEKLSSKDQVFVKDGDKCWFVKLEDVRLFESDGNYIKVYFDKFKPMIHKSLNALDERLDDRHFFRASRKHIINLGWVESIDTWFNGGLLVQLKGGEKIEVSRRQSARFREMMSL
ncbi:LytR/AlgR family response regulator transcription factor [Ekhidna sp.]|uniref:LytR/AlgR family response regulator transcription factor n=1 Tax=Ekhidna sp. TaxID=2608089 RepID=UPI0035124978